MGHGPRSRRNRLFGSVPRQAGRRHYGSARIGIGGPPVQPRTHGALTGNGGRSRVVVRPPGGIYVSPAEGVGAIPVSGVARLKALYLRMMTLAVRRPGLIPSMLGAAWAFRARDWYRRPPYLPLPSRRYLRWRMETAYGDPDRLPPAHDLERFLRWGSEMRKRAAERSR